jgi:hypothetical protein
MAVKTLKQLILVSYDAVMKFQPREAYTSKDFQEFNFVNNGFTVLRRLPHK